MECQNRTICRGPNSIFGRLRKEGIDVRRYYLSEILLLSLCGSLMTTLRSCH